MTDTSASSGDVNPNFEDPAFRDEFVAVSDEITATDVAGEEVSSKQLRARRERFLAETGAEYEDVTDEEWAELLAEARREA